MIFNSSKFIFTCKRYAYIRNIFQRGYKQWIDVLPEIKHAMQSGKPVIALESTIITHGMPFPQNLDTAREVEEIVRQNGATPATCALIDGRIKVGLNETALKYLTSKNESEIIKCSRRDLAVVATRGLSGGTTVAATMIIANMMGIQVFATGGIGGVHRDGHVTLDISADLIELGRTPVAVVCSGVKSILDIPRTLEFLETQGVCVASYGDANGCFPDFYTRDSGCKVPYNLDGPQEAANLIRTLNELQLQSGILIGVPIPTGYAINEDAIRIAIEEAQYLATSERITGKDVTPFLLEAIADITKGTSLQANIALIKNNASVAAQIAKELVDCKTKTFAVPKVENVNLPTPLVVGASILDLSLTLIDDVPTKLDGATYHTVARQSAGGVGRNIAEGILKLYGKANFLSVVGNDELGKSLLHLIPSPLREHIKIDTKHSTSVCSLIFDKMGDCKWILGNFEIHENITPKQIQANSQLIRYAPLLIMDSNLSIKTMSCVLALAGRYQCPVFFEPTDMRIAGKPFELPAEQWQNIKFISPNVHELRTIVETITKKPIDLINLHDPKEKIIDKANQMLSEIEPYFDCVIVTLGHHGVLLSLRTKDPNIGKQILFDVNTGKYIPIRGSHIHNQRFYPARHVEHVINVSGAGDSFCSGFITGILRGYDLDHSVSMGFLAAERALKSMSAVPKRYFENDHEQMQSLQHAMKTLRNT